LVRGSNPDFDLDFDFVCVCANCNEQGDISNLIGCILTRQLPFQTYLAAYFCCVDCCLTAQYLYYYKPSSDDDESSPISASTPLLEEGLAHSYGSTKSRRFSGVSASYPPPGLLPTTDGLPTHGLSISRSRSRVRALSLRGSTLSKRATLRELQTTAANIAQAADTLLHQQQGYQRPRSASYVGDSRSSALSRTGIDTATSIPRFREPKSDAEDDEVNLLAESYHSEAGGSHPRHRSITWTTTHLPSSPQPQPIERREVVDGGDESEDTILSGETYSTSLRQRSRSRGRPTTRHLFESTPLDAVPGSYVEDSQEASAPQVEGSLDKSGRHSMSTSGNRARGKRSAGIVFLGVGVGALFAFGARLNSNKEVGGRRGSAVEMGEGRVLGIGRGYPLEYQETGRLLSDYADTHTSIVQILYADIDDELPLPPHHPHQRTTEEKRRIIGRISAWTCTTLYLTSRLPQIWKNVSAFTRCLSLDSY
jgi:hypothetical protein